MIHIFRLTITTILYLELRQSKYIIVPNQNVTLLVRKRYWCLHSNYLFIDHLKLFSLKM